MQGVREGNSKEELLGGCTGSKSKKRNLNGKKRGMKRIRSEGQGYALYWKG